jgi:hypothetical protein
MTPPVTPSPLGLNDIARSFLVDGDLMRCRACDRSIHVSHTAPLRHRAGCCNRAIDWNPWTALAEAIAVARKDEK